MTELYCFALRSAWTQLKSLLRKMLVKRISLGNTLPTHAIKTCDIHKTQVPPLRQSPLFKSQIKTLFTDRHDFHQRKEAIAKITKSRRAKAPLDQRTRLQPYIIACKQFGVPFSKSLPLLECHSMVKIIPIQQGQ